MIHGGHVLLDTAPDVDGSPLEGPEGALLDLYLLYHSKAAHNYADH